MTEWLYALLFGSASLFPIAGLAAAPAPTIVPMQPACSEQKIAEIIAPASLENKRVTVDCSVSLASTTVITKEILITGKQGSGVRFDCKNGTLGDPTADNGTRSSHRLVIASAFDAKKNEWERPERVRVFNCRVNGTVRIDGMDSAASRESSRTPGHTARAQAAAPTDIILNNVRFLGRADRLKLLVGVGVTDLSITRSVFTGSSDAVGAYVGDEVKGVTIEGNVFEVQTTRREQLSLDGAAYVTVRKNMFRDFAYGGVYIYRNCGELGRVRVQAPAFNQIVDNVFVYAKNGTTSPSVWVGSRNIQRTERAEQCALDDGLGYGSSLAPGRPPHAEKDEAQNNAVSGNTIVRRRPEEVIKNDDIQNTVAGNVRADVVPKDWR